MLEAVNQSGNRFLLRNAQLISGEIVDLRIAGGEIQQLEQGLAEAQGEVVISAQGNLLLPGLYDHHLHLFATAAAQNSVACGPPNVNNQAELRSALAQAPGNDWLRGVGVDDSVCPGLNARWLDQLQLNRPVRLQHRSGMLWVFNSQAMAALNLSQPLPEGVELDGSGQPTGRFYNLDAWLGQRIPKRPADLTALSQALARFGITHLTDAGVNNNSETFSALSLAQSRGELRQKLLIMGQPSLATASLPVSSKIGLGPEKIYLREVNLPELEQLVARIDAAHRQQRPVAFHCVTLVEIHFAVAALAQTQCILNDRIEHASVADDYVLQQMATLGVTAVSQPQFIYERGDRYLKEVASEDLLNLYRGRSFTQAGVAFAAGSDAPYGSIDPWLAMRAAVNRRTRAGEELQGNEALTPLAALNLFGGDFMHPGGQLRALAAGQPADLVLMKAPWQSIEKNLASDQVALTFCDGNIIYADSQWA
ncbi:amidohydrolase family protein [Halioxenophilus aromaticivorans]|uniref:Amidohydrolase family protein n=1 Tax=Halioxenophilus aromaticivorans TaxID=1306992 RepID=A0AAV3U3K9_9ALTE